MNSPACDHVLHVDDPGPHAGLHLTLECSSASAPTGHDIDEDHCAATLDGWLHANSGRILRKLLVTTSRVHHGSFRPVVDVLARHRPEILRLGLERVCASGALRLRDRWSAFSNLLRLDVTGNAITAAAARILSETAPDVVDVGDQRIWGDDEPRFAPPLVGFVGALSADEA
jgi:hypothetical protein